MILSYLFHIFHFISIFDIKINSDNYYYILSNIISMLYLFSYFFFLFIFILILYFVIIIQNLKIYIFLLFIVNYYWCYYYHYIFFSNVYISFMDFLILNFYSNIQIKIIRDNHKIF